MLVALTITFIVNERINSELYIEITGGYTISRNRIQKIETEKTLKRKKSRFMYKHTHKLKSLKIENKEEKSCPVCLDFFDIKQYVV